MFQYKIVQFHVWMIWVILDSTVGWLRVMGKKIISETVYFLSIIYILLLKSDSILHPFLCLYWALELKIQTSVTGKLVVVITVYKNYWIWWRLFFRKLSFVMDDFELLKLYFAMRNSVKWLFLLQMYAKPEIWNMYKKIEFHTSGSEANFHSTKIYFLVGEDVSSSAIWDNFHLQSKMKKKKKSLWNLLFLLWLFLYTFLYRNHDINY